MKQANKGNRAAASNRVSNSARNESEDLADRLRSLYQTYNCEHELPPHDDLVAKLGSTEQEVRDAAKRGLDLGYVYPISYEKALEETKQSFIEKMGMCFALASVEGGEYAVSEFYKNKKEPNDFLLKIHAFYGGIKSLSWAIKTVFSASDEEDAKEYLKERNEEATKYFRGFKNNLAYFLNS